MASSTPTLILVAYYAPPVRGIASYRVRWMAEGLLARGWRVVAVLPEAPLHRIAPGDGLPDGVEVIRVPNPEPSRWFSRVRGRPTIDGASVEDTAADDPASRGGSTGVLRDLVRNVLYVPDARFPWIGAAAEAVRRRIRDAEGPTVVYSTSVPFSAHFAAMRGRGDSGVPWVAEYRDPWGIVPPQVGRRPGWRRALDARLDTEVLRAADAVVFTSESVRRAYLARAPFLRAERVGVVRNGWLRAAPDAAPGPGDPLRLVWVGTVNDSRFLDPLLRAVATAVAGGRACRIRVLGAPEPWIEALERIGCAPTADVVGDEGWLDLAGFVPPDAVPDELAAASATLLLQPRPDPEVNVAAKLFDYVAARRPVLAWLPRDGEMAEILRAGADPWFVDGTPGDVGRAIRELGAAQDEGRLAGPRVAEERIAPYSRTEGVRRLDAFLRGVLAGGDR